MEPNMKVNGKKTVLGALENLSIEMVTITREIGYTMKQMGLEFIKERMDQLMKEDGEEICSMAKVNKHGRMEATTKANLRRASSKASESTTG
jgi:hypothetical protein